MITKDEQSTTTLYSLFQEEIGHFHQGYWAPDMEQDSLDVAHVRYLQELTKNVQIQPGDVVLDLGCGGGGGAIWLAHTFSCFVHAIDLQEPNVVKAKQSVKQAKLENLITVHHMDALQLNFDTDFFDIIMAVESVYHIRDKQALFQGIKRVLKNEGHLLVADYLLESCPWLVSKLAAIFFESQYMVGIDRYRQMFKEFELQIIDELDVTEETIIKTFEWGQRTEYSLFTNIIYKAYGALAYHLARLIFTLPIVAIPRKLASQKTVSLYFFNCENIIDSHPL